MSEYKDMEPTPGPSGLQSFYNLSQIDEDDISPEVAAEIDALRLEEIEIKQITEHCNELEERLSKKEDEVFFVYEKNKSDQEKEKLLKSLILQTNETISAKRETLATVQQLYDQQLQKKQKLTQRINEAISDYDSSYERIKSKYDQLSIAVEYRNKLLELDFVKIKYNEMLWRVNEQQRKNKQIREIRFMIFQRDVVKFAETYIKYKKMIEMKKIVDELEKKFDLSDTDIKNTDTDKSSDEYDNKTEGEITSENYETNISVDKSKIEFPSPAIDMKALELPPLTPMSSIDIQMDDIPKPVLEMNFIDTHNYLPSKKQDMVQKYYETSSLATVSNDMYKKLIANDVLEDMKKKIQVKSIMKKDMNKTNNDFVVPKEKSIDVKKPEVKFDGYLKDFNKTLPKRSVKKLELHSVSFDDAVIYHPADVPVSKKIKFVNDSENKENIESDRKRKMDVEENVVKNFKQVTIRDNVTELKMNDEIKIDDCLTDENKLNNIEVDSSKEKKLDEELPKFEEIKKTNEDFSRFNRHKSEEFINNNEIKSIKRLSQEITTNFQEPFEYRMKSKYFDETLTTDQENVSIDSKAMTNLDSTVVPDEFIIPDLIHNYRQIQPSLSSDILTNVSSSAITLTNITDIPTQMTDMEILNTNNEYGVDDDLSDGYSSISDISGNKFGPVSSEDNFNMFNKTDNENGFMVQKNKSPVTKHFKLF